MRAVLTRRTIQGLALSLLIVLLPVAEVSAQETIVDGDPDTTERIGAADPVDFAVAVSVGRFADGAAEVVVLSRDDNFADSLAGSPLSTNGPLLFTQTDSLPDATATEIDRVLADDGIVYVLGGTAAIDQSVEDALDGSGREVQRLAGNSRVETALVTAAEVRRRNPDGTVVAIARAFGVDGNPTAAWADSVAAAAWAAKEQVPLVISPTDELPSGVADFLADDGPSETVLLGGEAALSTAVEAAVPGARRIAGGSRADTAAAIATELLDAPTAGDRTAVVFNAFTELGWTRGLAVAGLAAELGAPLLAVNPAGVPPATAGLISADGTSAQVELLVAAPTVEVGPQLVAELDELDAGPAAPARPAPGVPQSIAVEMANQASRFEQLDIGRTGSLVTFASNSNDLGEDDFGGPNSPGTSDTFTYDVVSGRLLDITSSGTAGAEVLGRPTAQAVAGDRFVFWNGQGSTDGIVRYDLFTGRSERVLTFIEISDFVIDATFGRDGTWLAYVLDGDLFRRPVDAQGPGEPLVTAREGQQEPNVGEYRISGDGSSVAAITGDFQTADARQAVLARPGLPPRLLSVGFDGQPADEDVFQIEFSADGSAAIFLSRATNLVEGAGTGGTHLYAVDVGTGEVRLVDRRPDGTESFGVRGDTDISDDGAVVAFTSDDPAFFGSEEFPGVEGLVTVNLDTGENRLEFDPRTLGEFVGVGLLSLSGDARRISFAITGAGATPELYLLDRL